MGKLKLQEILWFGQSSTKLKLGLELKPSASRVTCFTTAFCCLCHVFVFSDPLLHCSFLFPDRC